MFKSSVLVLQYITLCTLPIIAVHASGENNRDTTQQLDSHVDCLIADEIFQDVQRHRRISIITFKTDYVELSGAHPPKSPVTGEYTTVTGGIIRIVGTVAIVSNLAGDAPPAGHVNEEIPASSEWSGDAVYNRLRPLLHRSEDGKVFAICVGADNSKTISAFSFIGPLKESDIAGFVQVIQFTLKTDDEHMTETETRQEVDSHMGYISTIGLMRLESIGKSLPSDYFGVSQRYKLVNESLLWKRMWKQTNRGDFRNNFVDDLNRFLRTSDADSQAMVLGEVASELQLSDTRVISCFAAHKKEAVEALDNLMTIHKDDLGWTKCMKYYRDLVSYLTAASSSTRPDTRASNQ